MKGYNPIDIGSLVEKSISMDVNGTIYRKYYRFRATKFYGGSSTADVVGCNLMCIYCWSYRINSMYRSIGVFYSPYDVAHKLMTIARENRYRFIRITGGEPILAYTHLLQVLENLVSMGIRDIGRFIIETNGILLGYKPDIIRELVDYNDFITVRVSLKGCSEEEFSIITGADKNFYSYQLIGIKNLVDHGIDTRVVIPISFCKTSSTSLLLERLLSIDKNIIDRIEMEIVFLYRSNMDRLCRKGLKPWIAIDKRLRRVLRGSEIDEYFRRQCSENSYRDT